MATIAEAMESLRDEINEDSTIRNLQASVDNAMFNTNQQDGKWKSRFAIQMFYFGERQCDGAGTLLPVHFFMMTTKMKRAEEISAGELDFITLGEKLRDLIHRNNVGDFSWIWTGNMIFYESMTITNDRRRTTVKLEDDEVGLAVCFYATSVPRNALASYSNSKPTAQHYNDQGVLVDDDPATEAEKAQADLVLDHVSEMF